MSRGRQLGAMFVWKVLHLHLLLAVIPDTRILIFCIFMYNEANISAVHVD